MTYLATMAAPAHHRFMFERFQAMINFTVDIKGPHEAARLCDLKACEMDEVLLQTYEVGPQTLHTPVLIGVSTAELEIWTRQLRQQSRALRRHMPYQHPVTK